jgi:hypothetical protein
MRRRWFWTPRLTHLHTLKGFQLLEKELEDLKAKVRATEQRIQEEKNLIANSK